jgi:hypothetical protein
MRHYFSWSSGDQYGFDKKHIGTRYTELVFLHPVGSVGHVVHSSASEARNGDALFLMLGWDRYGFDKKMPSHVTLNCVFTFGGICRSRSAFQCFRGVKHRHGIFHARVGHVGHKSVLVLLVLASSSIACRTGALVAGLLCCIRSCQPWKLVYQSLRHGIPGQL